MAFARSLDNNIMKWAQTRNALWIHTVQTLRWGFTSCLRCGSKLSRFLLVRASVAWGEGGGGGVHDWLTWTSDACPVNRFTHLPVSHRGLFNLQNTTPRLQLKKVKAPKYRPESRSLLDAQRGCRQGQNDKDECSQIEVVCCRYYTVVCVCVCDFPFVVRSK